MLLLDDLELLIINLLLLSLLLLLWLLVQIMHDDASYYFLRISLKTPLVLELGVGHRSLEGVKPVFLFIHFLYQVPHLCLVPNR